MFFPESQKDNSAKFPQAVIRQQHLQAPNCCSRNIRAGHYYGVAGYACAAQQVIFACTTTGIRRVM